MPNTTVFSRGAVVLVRFPFTDLQGTKQRPALVISSEAYGREGEDVILAAITSGRFANPGPFDHPLAEWESAGLLRPSVVRAGKVVTLSVSMLRKAIGAVTAEDLVAVERQLKKALSLS